MYFHWAEHEARVGWLTPFERGVFDMVRSALWQVEGCRMPMEALVRRLRAFQGTEIASALETLLTPSSGLLALDEAGNVFDPVQVGEFANSVQKAEMNRANGKLGGRPRKLGQCEMTKAPAPEPLDGKDF